jgi:hypothetical protein
MHGRPMTEEEYERYIEPFEALDRLQRIRATVRPDEIVEAQTVPPLKAKIAEFPDSLTGPQSANFKQVHSMLMTLKESTLGGVDADLAVQQHRLKNRVKHLFRFLWILAAYGQLEEANGQAIVIDPETYKNNRGSETQLMVLSTLEGVIFSNLAEVGVEAKIVELAKDWKTPMGFLRMGSWKMKLTFTEKLGGLASLNAFQEYGKALKKKHGKRAFRYFKDADMSVLVGT